MDCTVLQKLSASFFNAVKPRDLEISERIADRISKQNGSLCPLAAWCNSRMSCHVFSGWIAFWYFKYHCHFQNCAIWPCDETVHFSILEGLGTLQKISEEGWESGLKLGETWWEWEKTCEDIKGRKQSPGCLRAGEALGGPGWQDWACARHPKASPTSESHLIPLSGLHICLTIALWRGAEKGELLSEILNLTAVATCNCNG